MSEQNELYDADLVGIDLETGGLNGYETLESGERVHGALYRPIIEMGLVVPCFGPCGQGTAGEDRKLRVAVSLTDDVLARLDFWALEQHKKSGLLDDIRNDIGFDFVGDIRDVEQYVINWLEMIGVRRFNRKEKFGAMAFGNSVSFDMEFINAQMPELYKFFHYRKVDVSAVNCLARTIWAHHGFDFQEKELEHTALNDICETLSELNGYSRSLNGIPKVISRMI